VAEGARLESVFTRKGNGGSNPSLSASFSHQVPRTPGFRLRALTSFTPAKRLKFESLSLRQFPFGRNDLEHLPQLEKHFPMPAVSHTPSHEKWAKGSFRQQAA
jgi:hypothetical protein